MSHRRIMAKQLQNGSLSSMIDNNLILNVRIKRNDIFSSCMSPPLIQIGPLFCFILSDMGCSTKKNSISLNCYFWSTSQGRDSYSSIREIVSSVRPRTTKIS